MTGALNGLRIIEWSDGLPGSYCAKLFADLGADVIKIEHPTFGDPLRMRGPFPNDIPHPERSALFHALNANKRGITLDPSTRDGADLLAALLAKADVIIEDHPPGTLVRLGFNRARLQEINNRLIVTSITPFGQSGPYAHFLGTDLVVYQMSGHGYGTPGSIEHPEQEPPLRIGADQVAFPAAINAAIATMEAIFARQRDGIGRYIDVSMQEVIAGFSSINISTYSYSGETPSRLKGSRRAAVALLPCRDGYICLVALEEHQWQNWLEIMGRPEWGNNPLFADRASRAKHWDALESLLSEWTSQHDREEIVRAAQERRVPVLPVNSIEEVMASAQFAARKFFVPLSVPELPAVRIPAVPYHMSQTPWTLRRSAPRLGQDNEEVYCRELGLEAAELVRLRRLSVI